jgi:hypothetical protein
VSAHVSANETLLQRFGAAVCVLDDARERVGETKPKFISLLPRSRESEGFFVSSIFNAKPQNSFFVSKQRAINIR